VTYINVDDVVYLLSPESSEKKGNYSKTWDNTNNT
jgi:hypothetical protein